jgi:hypothetical protein
MSHSVSVTFVSPHKSAATLSHRRSATTMKLTRSRLTSIKRPLTRPQLSNTSAICGRTRTHERRWEWQHGCRWRRCCRSWDKRPPERTAHEAQQQIRSPPQKPSHRIPRLGPHGNKIIPRSERLDFIATSSSAASEPTLTVRVLPPCRLSMNRPTVSGENQRTPNGYARQCIDHHRC